MIISSRWTLHFCIVSISPNALTCFIIFVIPLFIPNSISFIIARYFSLLYNKFIIPLMTQIIWSVIWSSIGKNGSTISMNEKILCFYIKLCKKGASHNQLTHFLFCLTICHLWDIQQLKFHSSAKLQRRDYLSFVLAESDIFPINVPVALVQHLNKSASRSVAIS